ncbi:hypothetical protein ACAG39_01745 [Caldicellulosiruptoraceae bacterium PP1]
MIKFAVVYINSIRACNIYMLSSSGMQDTQDVKKKLSTYPISLLNKYIIDVEKGNVITRIVYQIPEKIIA